VRVSGERVDLMRELDICK